MGHNIHSGKCTHLRRGSATVKAAEGTLTGSVRVLSFSKNCTTQYASCKVMGESINISPQHGNAAFLLESSLNTFLWQDKG
jgi:hypothetical protein